MCLICVMNINIQKNKGKIDIRFLQCWVQVIIGVQGELAKFGQLLPAPYHCIQLKKKDKNTLKKMGFI